MLDYCIDLDQRAAHRFGVELRFDATPFIDADGCITLSLPVWIPGSYMVREFARHLQALTIKHGRRQLAVQAIDKSTWCVRVSPPRVNPSGRKAPQVAAKTVELCVHYEVYAFDASVRAAWLDADRAFFNGTSLFVCVHGAEDVEHSVRFKGVPKTWHVATAMRRGINQGSTSPSFKSANYDELVDHPFELGAPWRGHFEAHGVLHELVVTGAWPNFDGERLLADTKRICQTQLEFWHGKRVRAKDVPFERYVFMLQAVDDGYGGLEHRASTALIAARRDLPTVTTASQARAATPPTRSDAYVTLLGLISHEYFHAWNVKRLKPSELARIDYARENHTELLWFFEGFTSYYDDLFLRRSGLIDDVVYLKLLGKAISGVLGTPGRLRQSVAASSFDAWTKYYRQDEDSVNSIVSYYTKGSLVALACDLTMRASGKGTLDDVMRALWKQSNGGAIDERAIIAALSQAAGRSMAAEMQAWVHGTDDGPWLACLERMGVQVTTEASQTLSARWGVRMGEGSVGSSGVASGPIVRQVLRGSVAERAGLSAQDELLAVDGWRIRRLDDARAWCLGDRPTRVTIVRRERLREVVVDGRAGDTSRVVTVSLLPSAKADATLTRRRMQWLGGL